MANLRISELCQERTDLPWSVAERMWCITTNESSLFTPYEHRLARQWFSAFLISQAILRLWRTLCIGCFPGRILKSLTGSMDPCKIHRRSVNPPLKTFGLVTCHTVAGSHGEEWTGLSLYRCEHSIPLSSSPLRVLISPQRNPWHWGGNLMKAGMEGTPKAEHFA